MPGKKPDYEDWKSSPDLSGETPNTPEGHRILIWLWVIGLLFLSLLVLGIGYLATFLQPGPHGNQLFAP